MLTNKHPLAKCDECPLQKNRMAQTCGPKDAKIVVVSRSPGTADVRAKRPFAGKSGEVLDHLLKLNGVKREEILTTNTVLCYHDGPPPKEAIKACSARLQEDIRFADTIIAAGSEAVVELTRRKSLDGSRGYVHERRTEEGKVQRVVATNNPAIVLRDDSTFPNLVRDFKLALNPLPSPDLPQVDWTNSIAEGRRWLQLIDKQKVDLLGVDIETKGLRPMADLVAIGFSATGDKSISFGERVCGDDYTYRNYIAPLVRRSRERQFLYHNGKFDVRNLVCHGVDAVVNHDTMLLSWALDERSDENQVHRLDYLLMNELNWPNYEPPEVVEWKRKIGLLEKQYRYEELSALPTPDALYEYNALDVAGTAQLFPILKDRALEDNVYERPYLSYLIQSSAALIKVELAGTNYDVERACDLLEEEVWPKLTNLKAELQLIVGDGAYNPNSAPQNAALVYDRWNIQHSLPTKNDRTVDKSVYTEIKAARFICGTPEERRLGTASETKETAIRWASLFADFKELDKQRSTYLEGLIVRAVHSDGRIYTDFKLHNTVTGRLSSSRPNLQNITRTKPGLPNIRSLFVASPGRRIVQADYSQAELRTLAALSGDPQLTAIYRNGEDLHDRTAERFYGVGFTKEQRAKAKNMNFGVPYGQSAETFQEKHDVPVDEGKEFIKWWFSNFKGVAAWRDAVAKELLSTGEVVSPYGYKRRFHLITAENKNAVIREGINFLPQNIAAVTTLLSLVEAVDKFDPNEAEVILNVHDANILDVNDNAVDEVSNSLLTIMRAAPKKYLDWDFPFDADVQIGQSWGELE